MGAARPLRVSLGQVRSRDAIEGVLARCGTPDEKVASRCGVGVGDRASAVQETEEAIGVVVRITPRWFLG